MGQMHPPAANLHIRCFLVDMESQVLGEKVIGPIIVVTQNEMDLHAGISQHVELADHI